MSVRPPVHWPNPWADAIPVPLEELAACVAGGTVRVGDRVEAYDLAYVLKEWKACGERLDGYLIVRGPAGGEAISVGVRYGAEGHQYLSPYCADRRAALALADKYRRGGEEEKPNG